MTVTIYDVAKEAGVSVATVSRVINNTQGVKQETKLKVQRAIDELHYQYNQSAVALATGKTGVMALLIPKISNPFYSQVADGVYHEALSKGIDVVTFTLLGRDEPNLQFFSHRSIDGLLAMDVPKKWIGRLKTLVENIVLIGNDFFEGQTSCVTTDNFYGTQQMMTYVFSQGHRRIAMLSEPPLYNDISERIRGYNSSMDAFGLSQYINVRYAGGMDIEDGERVGREWIEQGLEHTAVFAGNDMLAIGLIKAFRDSGIRVPEDISVSGFDGSWVTSIVDPPLTTVRQPMNEMGRVGLNLLLDLINVESEDRARKIVLPPTLVVGGTVGAHEPEVPLLLDGRA